MLKEKIYILSKKYSSRFGLDLVYFVKNGYWVALRHLFGLIGGILIYVVFTRWSTQEILGQYQLVLSIFAIVSLFSIPGLNTAITQSVSRGNDGDYVSAVKLSFFWSLVGVPILLLAGFYFYAFKESLLMGMALIVSSIFFPFFYAPNTWDSFFQGKGRFDVASKYGILQTLFNTIVATIVIFFSPNNVIFIVIAYLASYSVFNIIFYKKSLSFIENEKSDRETISYGWFLTRINFLNIISTHIDKFLVGMLIGVRELAVYTIISLVALKIRDFSKTFSILFLPKLSREKNNLQWILRKHHLKLLILFLFIFLITGAYYFGIDSVNNILFTAQYSEFNKLSRIFSVSVFLYLPLGFVGYYIRAKKNERAIILTGPVFNLIKIVIEVFLIIKYSLLGAVIAFNLSMVVWFLIHLFPILFFKKQSNFS